MRPLALILLMAACSPDDAGLRPMARDAAPEAQQASPVRDLSPDLYPVAPPETPPDARPLGQDVGPDVVAAPDAVQPLVIDARPIPGTATATATKTTIDPSCTDNPKPSVNSSFYDGTCASYAEGQCGYYVSNPGYCDATCLRCSGGCVDVRPTGNPNGGLSAWVRAEYESEDTTDCAVWLRHGKCSDVATPDRYFCRKTCGLCVP